MALKSRENVIVAVDAMFLPDHSIIAQNLYFWAYTVIIENLSLDSVQLLFRRWRIIDANGDITGVEGEGVIGEQPIIDPGKYYQYSSGTYLKTTSGVMLGQYEMLNMETKKQFFVQIPTFSLDSPYELHLKS